MRKRKSAIKRKKQINDTKNTHTQTLSTTKVSMQKSCQTFHTITIKSNISREREKSQKRILRTESHPK